MEKGIVDSKDYLTVKYNVQLHLKNSGPSFYYFNSFLPHFRLKIVLHFAHADEAKRAYLHGYERIIKWLPFCAKVYTQYL